MNSVNDHIRSKFFPAQLNYAKVVLLYENGGKDNPNIYWPIFLLQPVSKLNSFVVNLVENLTVDALVHITETVRHDTMHGYEPPAAVFLDYKKAFDIVDHSILIKKLE